MKIHFCESCAYRFHNQEDDRDQVAECRRFPPTFHGPSLMTTSWPITHRHDWCGEWRDIAEIDWPEDGA